MPTWAAKSWASTAAVGGFEADEADPVAELVVHLLEVGHLLLARRAGAVPEVQDQRRALERAQGDRRALRSSASTDGNGLPVTSVATGMPASRQRVGTRARRAASLDDDARRPTTMPPAVPTTTAASQRDREDPRPLHVVRVSAGDGGAAGRPAPAPQAGGRDVGGQGHLVHHQLGPGCFGGRPRGRLWATMRPFEQELATPDAPRLLAVEGRAQARADTGTSSRSPWPGRCR